MSGLGYRRCPECAATFLERPHLPDTETELARYREHRNDPADPAYLAFLDRLARPLLERLPPNRHGLDYGCGPGPALAGLLTRHGHSVRLYDPFFKPDAAALEDRYDFITCTATAEHFHRPAEEFARFDRMLRPGGWLGVMTRFLADDDRFADWHYRRDPTHVVFYKEATFRHIAAHYRWNC
ncbi:MAG TPA: class I SAM-dependent methyltransferase, partial [candidate division WOR-3 bacterium]|nr:class I SAM-dependent methyltransferase [candidate division WOR-3 bacterium]